ncbi:MAG: hypothetical protein WAT92_20480 [Saprospiraceae bacterium]
MDENRKYIELFTALIKNIDAKNRNNEFSTELIANLQSSLNSNLPELNNQLVSFYNDIKRTRYFLKHIDKNDWLEGFKYFEHVIIPELKMELIKDFKEMKIADRTNDIIEYARRLVMQLENCLNTVIEIEKAHEKIVSNPTQYQDNHNNLRQGKYSFFNDIDTPKELKEISLPSKLYFAKQYYGFNYYFKPIDEMIKIRNKASHRGEISSQEQKIMDNAKNNVSQKKAEYFGEFDKIVNQLKALYNVD